jgi:heat shock protein 1/8
LKDKISAEDIEIISKQVANTQKWLDENGDAEASDYERKQKEVEDLFNPIMSKIYQSAEAGA